MGRAVGILRQCVEGTAVMKVSLAALAIPSVSQHRDPVGRHRRAARPCPASVRADPPREALLGMLPASSEAAVLFLHAGSHGGLQAAADWSMLDPTGTPALWPC